MENFEYIRTALDVGLNNLEEMFVNGELERIINGYVIIDDENVKSYLLNLYAEKVKCYYNCISVPRYFDYLLMSDSAIYVLRSKEIHKSQIIISSLNKEIENILKINGLSYDQLSYAIENETGNVTAQLRAAYLVINSKKRSIESVGSWISRINNESIEETRQRFLSYAYNATEIKGMLADLDTPLENETKTIAMNAGDGSKAVDLGNLFCDLSKERDRLEKFHTKLNLKNLPRKMVKMLKEGINLCGEDYCCLRDASDVRRIYEDFKKLFNDRRKLLSKKMDSNILALLSGHYLYVDFADVDLDFLRLHEDILSKEDIDELENAVLMKEKIKRNGETTEGEIARYDEIIEEKQEALYETLDIYYENILGIDFAEIITLYGNEHKGLEKFNDSLSRKHSAILNYKYEIDSASEKYDEGIRVRQNVINEIIANIRLLLNDPKFDVEKIDISPDLKTNLDYIIAVYIKVYVKYLLKKAYEAAKERAAKEEKSIMAANSNCENNSFDLAGFINFDKR